MVISAFCFIFYQITVNTSSYNNPMVINKKASKIYKLFVYLSYDLPSSSAPEFASIIYTGIHLQKLLDNMLFSKI